MIRSCYYVTHTFVALHLTEIKKNNNNNMWPAVRHAMNWWKKKITSDKWLNTWWCG